METLETVLLSIYYDYIPNQIRIKNKMMLSLDRSQMIAFLTNSKNQLENLETDLAEDYGQAIQELQQMTDEDYKKLKGRVVPSER